METFHFRFIVFEYRDVFKSYYVVWKPQEKKQVEEAQEV